MDTIVLASRNEHKIIELRQTLEPLGIELKSALDFSNLKEVEEDKLTLEGNAIKKAQYVYEETGLPALADDTGLEVDALDGRPGVFSARYAGEEATYEENVQKLLAELAGVEPKDRKAQFRTVAALVSDEGTHTFEGVCRGEILTEKRGAKGFGYDPVFQPEDYKETFAEMDPETKNKISHRGRAIQQLLDWLKEHE
jgi:XTP/dITP diphosphohydrolase